MNTRASVIALLLTSGVLLGLSPMQPTSKPASTGPSAPTPPTPPTAPKFSIADAAFLAGTWRGEMDGAFVEEMWSAPQGNNIVGTFRWLKKDGKPMLLEMLAITQDDGAVRLRLRRYMAALTAKEDADKPLTLKLSQVTAVGGTNRAVFTAEKDAQDLKEVVYERKGDALAIDVVFQPEEDGKEREALKFRLKRHVER